MLASRIQRVRWSRPADRSFRKGDLGCCFLLGLVELIFDLFAGPEGRGVNRKEVGKFRRNLHAETCPGL